MELNLDAGLNLKLSGLSQTIPRITGLFSKFSTLKKIMDFMEQLQQGFSDSTPKAGSDRLQKSSKVC